jgi:hypothetical protein
MKFLKELSERQIKIVALNANANRLHASDGQRQSEAPHGTIALAGESGIKNACLMSGLRVDREGERMPHRIVSSWAPETQTVFKMPAGRKAVPALDAFLDAPVQATTSPLENGPVTDIPCPLMEPHNAWLSSRRKTARRISLSPAHDRLRRLAVGRT